MLLLKLLLKCIENFSVTLAIFVIIFTVVYFSNYFRICYYVYKIPGPRAYPIIGNALMLLGSNEESAKNLYKTFDSTLPLSRIWLGPFPMMVSGNPNYIQEILSNHSALEKPFIMRYMSYPITGDSILTSKVAKWKRNRSIIIKGFSPVILKTYFPVFVEKSLILTEKLKKYIDTGESFDIFHYLTKTSVDSICGSTMGVNINAHERQASYFHAMESCMYLMASRGLHPWKYPGIIYRLTDEYKHLVKHRRIVQNLPTEIINQKRQNQDMNKLNNNNEEFDFEVFEKSTLKKPLIHYLLESTENNPAFTEEDLRDETNMVIMAGYETSANAMSYCLLNIAGRPEIQKKLYDEIFSIFGDSDRFIELEDLSKLEFLDLVIKESMRLFPTIPLIIRELTRDIKIDKYIVPKGSNFAIPIFCLHRDPNLWENPLEFIPERFTPENISKRHPYSYIPFSGGPRNCIGGRYAMMFMKTTITTLLRYYELHTDLNLRKIKFDLEVSLKLIGGHQIRITPRKRII